MLLWVAFGLVHIKHCASASVVLALFHMFSMGVVLKRAVDMCGPTLS